MFYFVVRIKFARTLAKKIANQAANKAVLHIRQWSNQYGKNTYANALYFRGFRFGEIRRLEKKKVTRNRLAILQTYKYLHKYVEMNATQCKWWHTQNVSLTLEKKSQ